MKLKERYQQLVDLKAAIQSEGFQNFIIGPLTKELEGIKYAYDCQSLRELSVMKGRRQGLKKLMEILKDVEVELNNTFHELEEEKDIEQ